MVAKILQVKKDMQIDGKINFKSLSFWIIASVILLAGLAIYLPVGLSNSTDIFWLQLDTVLYANGITNPENPLFKISNATNQKFKIIQITDKYDELKKRYKQLHKDKPVEEFDSILANPFPWMDDYIKFNNFLAKVNSKMKLVVLGVTGSGKTTIIDRASRFITGSPNNLLKLECVEKLEVEYHKEYIGIKTSSGFQPGKFLKFLALAQDNPTENYIFIIDDIDKIYPATLFGSEVWKEMDNADYSTFIDGYNREIYFPSNLFIISVTHSDVGNVIEMNSEHFRRLGDLYFLPPNYKVFLLYLIEKRKNDNPNYSQIKKLIYSFQKINDLINEEYGIGSTLGQWSQLRKKIKEDEYNDFLKEFITHVNGFKPENELKIEDFNDIIYSIENGGKIPRTSDFAIAYQDLQETGIFSELSVGVAFAVFSGIVGWIILRRRKRFVEGLNKEIIQIQDDYEKKEIDFEAAISSIINLKEKVKSLTTDGKVKYEEYIFFSLFIDESIKKIESINNASLITSGFEETFEEFMADGKIDDSEYLILIKFLENMKSALPIDIYYSIKNKIDGIHTESNS